jgi:hypothetical protein
MSTIRIQFDDLCAFLTKHSDRLMVGMISTDEAEPEYCHQSHVVIRQDGVGVREHKSLKC